jgi:hypothetical protein
MYRPPDFEGADNDLDEYLELRNIAATNVPLYSIVHPTNTWRLRKAVDFDFPAAVTLPPGGHLLVVGFDPANTTRLAEFRSTYSLSATTLVLGPWNGKLDNSGEAIELLRPDLPNTNTVPYILVEKIAYRDRAPWPPAADGLGSSLQREPITAFGNDPAHWFAAPPTPGANNSVLRFSAVDLSPDGSWVELGFEAMAGRAYTLQSILLSPGAAWSNTDTIPSASTNRIVTISIPLADHPGRIFRLVTPALP